MRSRPDRSEPADHKTETRWPVAVDSETLAYADLVDETFADRSLSPEDREFVRQNVPLRSFYETYLEPVRRAAVQSGDLAAGTLQKDRQALARWERFTEPTDWPTGRDWLGLPVGRVSTRYVEAALVRMKTELGIETVRSTWNHLRTMFRGAAALGALDHAPKPAVTFARDSTVAVYNHADINRACEALASAPDLQVAFVLACNAGPRPVDLFLLEWSRTDLASDRPTITFRSRKTGKTQTIPLAPLTVRHLERLPRSTPWLFPGRSCPTSADPERSRPARRRRDELGRLFAAVGLDLAKPFQAARATCNTRLNRAREGSGVFVLGHGLTLNARSYTEPTELIWEAVNAVDQPPAFRAALTA